ncbi:hypothetical protein P5673_033424 [Acropora cervicornis]|uniref:Uncharacterized protein n=1 Tax=Acropora cervicornis TaxID=6130 RepID=A0AAD9PQ73_ACRCE|nr:hypothetical protein P5673_033424 [Acropora cervicornis]
MAQSTSRFRLPKTASEEEICCLREVPKSTKYKNKWSVKILEEWQRVRTVKVPVLDVTGIFKDYDVAKVQLLADVSLFYMDAHSLNYWLANFNSCTNFVKGLPLLNYLNVCTASPKYGKAFCDEHLQYLARNHPNIPTDLRGFLAYCGIQRSEEEIGEQSNENMSGQEVTKVDAVLSSFHHDELSQLGNSAMMCQGSSTVEE